MKRRFTIFSIAILFTILITGCTSETNSGEIYQPIGLRKLTPGEMIDRIVHKNMAMPSRILDAEGNEISVESMKSFDPQDYFHDMYVDGKGILREVVIRKATKEDREVMKRIEEATRDLGNAVQ